MSRAFEPMPPSASSSLRLTGMVEPSAAPTAAARIPPISGLLSYMSVA
jgi:hypothetical protein